MPAGRIFPHKVADSLGSPLEIQTIDVNEVARMMKELEGRQASVQAPSFVRTASRQVDEVPVPRLRRAEITGECRECGVPHPCSHDIYAAQQEGDTAKIAAFKQIRTQRRMAALERVEAEAAAERELVARSQVRREMLAALDQIEDEQGEELLEAVDKRVAAKPKPKAKTAKSKVCGDCGKPGGLCKCRSGKACKCGKGDACTCDDGEACGFKGASQMTSSEKTTFASYLEAQGFPREYIDAQLKPKVTLPESIIKVASSDIDIETKKTILTAMLKEAKLAPEQKQRFLSYWKEDLEYQDTEWIDDAAKDPSNVG